MTSSLRLCAAILLLQVLVESRRLARLVVAFCQVGRVAGRLSPEASGQLEVAVPLVEVRGDRLAPGDVLVDLGHCRQPCGRAIGLADCDLPA